MAGNRRLTWGHFQAGPRGRGVSGACAQSPVNGRSHAQAAPGSCSLPGRGVYVQIYFATLNVLFFIFFIWGRAGGWSGASELTAHGQGGRRSPGGRPSPAQTGGHGHAGSPTRAAPRACSGVCALGGLRGVQERHVTRVHIQHRPSFPLYTFSAQAHEISREARSRGQEGKGAPGTRVAQFVTL